MPFDYYFGRHSIRNRTQFATFYLYREARSVELIVGRWQFVISHLTKEFRAGPNAGD